MQTYLKVENLLVPICQLVPQSLDLSGGWIQLRIQCSDHLQGGEKKNSSEYESDYCFQTRIKKEKKSLITHIASFLQVHFVPLFHGPHVIILLLQSSHQLIQFQGLESRKK